MSVLNQLAVSAKVADRGIDLAKGNFHEAACPAGMIGKGGETGRHDDIVGPRIKRKIFENLDSLAGVDTLPTRWPHRLVA